jgi:hypothetical protein
MNRRRTLLGWCAVNSLVWATQSVAAPPDFSGHWELRFDSRSVPRAELTAAARAAGAAHVRNDIEGLRWCRTAGLAASMDGPINIRQSATETVIVSPMPAVARHLYTDGRSQISLEDFDPTTVGFSVGHWDGEVLVVDTLGFSDRGLLAVPGGGFRTSKSRLTERYRLLDQGQRLSVTFLWADPGVYVKPHSYEFRYYRTAATATEWPCEPKESGREEFFAPAVASYSLP